MSSYNMRGGIEELLIGYNRATSLYAGRLPAVTEVLDSSTLDLRKPTFDFWSGRLPMLTR